MSLVKVTGLVITKKNNESITLDEDEIREVASVFTEFFPRVPPHIKVPFVIQKQDNKIPTKRLVCEDSTILGKLVDIELICVETNHAQIAEDRIRLKNKKEK